MSQAEDTIASLRTRGWLVKDVGAAMMALSITAVGLRFAAKSMGDKNRWGLDDVLISFALLVYLVDEALIIVALDTGADATDATSPEWSAFSKYVVIYSILYWTIIAFVTYSILWLYRRIFATHRIFSICSWTVAAVVTIWWISGTIIDGTAYQPLAAYWDSSLTGSYIINYNDFWIGDMVIELFFEAAVIGLPLLEIAKLNLDKRKKVFMIAMFAMGGFVLITGILRIIYAWKASDMIPGTVWLGVHGAVAIISACLPTYRPLLSKVPGLIPTTRRGTMSGTYGKNSTWRSTARKDSIPMPENDDKATLKHSHSFDHALMDKPYGLQDVQLHEIETGHKFDFATPAHVPHPDLAGVDEAMPSASGAGRANNSEETLQDLPALGPSHPMKHFP